MYTKGAGPVWQISRAGKGVRLCQISRHGIWRTKCFTGLHRLLQSLQFRHGKKETGPPAGGDNEKEECIVLATTILVVLVLVLVLVLVGRFTTSTGTGFHRQHR